MDCAQIISEWLGANGFDGLFNSDGECACLCDNLAPCGEISSACEAGYKVPCDGTLSCCPCNYHVVANLPDPRANDQLAKGMALGLEGDGDTAGNSGGD